MAGERRVFQVLFVLAWLVLYFSPFMNSGCSGPEIKDTRYGGSLTEIAQECTNVIWLPMVAAEIYQTVRRLHHNLYPQIIVNVLQALIFVPTLGPVMMAGYAFGLERGFER